MKIFGHKNERCNISMRILLEREERDLSVRRKEHGDGAKEVLVGRGGWVSWAEKAAQVVRTCLC